VLEVESGSTSPKHIPYVAYVRTSVMHSQAHGGHLLTYLLTYLLIYSMVQNIV